MDVTTLPPEMLAKILRYSTFNTISMLRKRNRYVDAVSWMYDKTRIPLEGLRMVEIADSWEITGYCDPRDCNGLDFTIKSDNYKKPKLEALHDVLSRVTVSWYFNPNAPYGNARPFDDNFASVLLKNRKAFRKLETFNLSGDITCSDGKYHNLLKYMRNLNKLAVGGDNTASPICNSELNYVAAQFKKKIKQTIRDHIYSLRPRFQLYCSGSLESIAKNLMQNCYNCQNTITSVDSKDSEDMYILFNLKEKNDKFMSKLFDACSFVRRYEDTSEFFDSAKVQCKDCQMKSHRKRSLSVEETVENKVNPIVKEKAKRGPKYKTVKKAKKTVISQPPVKTTIRKVVKVVKAEIEAPSNEKIVKIENNPSQILAASHQLVKEVANVPSARKVLSVSANDSEFPAVKRARIEVRNSEQKDESAEEEWLFPTAIASSGS